MRIIEKIRRKAENRHGEGAVTLAFLGDSITEGCFDVYVDRFGKVCTYVDESRVYHAEIKHIFGKLYPDCALNIINAGISGANARGSLGRVERDVISHGADFALVSFGSNDMSEGFEGVAEFKKNMSEIVRKLLGADIEVMVMSAPMNCTYVSHLLHEKELRDIAEVISGRVNAGVLKAYAKAAGEVAEECGVRFLDLYAEWERLYNAGVDVTALLENHINHPNGDMHKEMASLIVREMFR